MRSTGCSKKEKSSRPLTSTSIWRLSRTFSSLYHLLEIYLILHVYHSNELKYKLCVDLLIFVDLFSCSTKHITLIDVKEWGWTARIAIARHAFARHFWQQINCSTQILSFARIQLILAKPDSSKWQKKWQLLDRQ